MAKSEVSGVNVVSSPELVAFINSTERSDSQILRQIESLSVSADAKALLADLLKLATRVGQAVIRVGRKIIDFVLSLVRAFPHMGFAALIAVVVTALISLVPFIGLALTSILGPLPWRWASSWAAWWTSSPLTSRRVCVTLPQSFPGWLHDTATLGTRPEGAAG